MFEASAEADFPHLHLDLSDAEDEDLEILPSATETKDFDDTADSNGVFQLPIKDFGYLPVNSTKVLKDYLQLNCSNKHQIQKSKSRPSLIEKIIKRCKSVPVKPGNVAQFPSSLCSHVRKPKAVYQKLNEVVPSLSNNNNNDKFNINFKELDALRINSSTMWKIQLNTEPVKLTLQSEGNGVVVLTWDFPNSFDHKLVQSYRVFAQQLNLPWEQIGEVESMRLPMGCRLNELEQGKSYSFKVQPVFSGNISGLNSNECLFESIAV